MNILQAIQENNLVSLFLFAPAANGGNAVPRNKKCFGYFLVEILDYLCYNKNKKLVELKLVKWLSALDESSKIFCYICYIL